jgi:diketogulonate reductase-like aldo/keto reductase|tara:strand:- start:132 stop:980 length:849 start_codon:yes stop_codon:yes gene_type:complete
MKTKRLPNGFEIPVLGIGTVNIGEIAPLTSDETHKPDFDHDQENINAIKEAIKIGYNHIDTAELYGQGHTEELVGKAIKDFDRKKLFITTKVSPEHLKYNDLIASVKKSLKRLGTDYIDLYLIHRPNPDIPIKETIEAMNYLVDKKIIRFIGVSAFNIEQIKEAQKHSKHPIVANQLKFSIYKKSDLKTVKFCQDNNIVVIAYKLFGRGLIDTKKINLIMGLSKKYNKTEGQIILNWTISKNNMVAIFKSTNIKHLKENKDVFDFKLTDDEIKKIDALVPSL